MSILKLAGLQEQAMIQVTPPGTPKPPAMQPQLTLPQTQTQMAPTAMGGSTTAVSGSDVKQPGQMEEELHGDQHKLDVDKDGEIEGSDLAKLRAKQVDERVSIDASPEEIQQYMQFQKSLSQRMSQQAADPAHTPMPGNKLSPVDQYNAIQQDVNKAYMPARGSQLGPQNNLRNDSDAGRYAAPGLGDQGQFFGGMKEDGVDEGNEFTEKLLKTPKGGKFKIGDRVYTDTSNLEESEQIDECGDMGPMANGMTDKQESRMNVSTNMSSDGTKTVTVTADGEAAEELMQLLSLAGMQHDHKEPEVMMYEEKDTRYEASTTPDEKVLPLETQLKGGTGEVAGKTKKMTPHGYKYADNNLAMKENQVNESKTLNFLKEYESLLVKKKISESDSPRAQDRFGLELGDLLIETNVLGVTKDGIVLETDTWSYNHLNKLGYISKEELTESTMIFEGEQTVNIEDHDTGERIDVIVNYSSDDGEIVFDEVEVVNNPEKELSNAELNEVYKELINILQQTAEPDYYTDDDDRLDPRQREYYSNFPMNYTGTKDTMEAKYQGREVPLGKPMAGDVAKSKVYVRGPKGNVVKVNFGDKNMRIKKSNPKRRKSFRARHNCANPGPRWRARYWSCRAW